MDALGNGSLSLALAMQQLDLSPYHTSWSDRITARGFSQGQTFDGEYYKGLFSSSLDQRYTRQADENSDVDMLSRNIKLGLYAVGFLAALVIAFLWSNGVL